jgi:hypothetical protein
MIARFSAGTKRSALPVKHCDAYAAPKSGTVVGSGVVPAP